MISAKKILQKIANQLGYEVHRLNSHVNGKDPFSDMSLLITRKDPVVFDAGANIGQSIKSFRSKFPDCSIHSFEPSASTFKELTKNVSHLKDIHLWNFGLGSSNGMANFHDNSISLMSSFLPLGSDGAGKVVTETMTEIKALDEFCLEENIRQIDILKSDTQGFDLEVLKGAENMILEGKIGLIYLEVIFSEMYQNVPSFSEVFDFLTSRNYRLVSFYKLYYQEEVAGWTDALFVHESHMLQKPKADLSRKM